MRVIFYDMEGRVVVDRTLKLGVDFLCRGSWVSDAKASHTRTEQQHFYAKDIEGRLIGHKAYSAGGTVPLLGFIPMPVFVMDAEWWRIEPARPTE